MSRAMVKIFYHALRHARLNRVVDQRKGGSSCLDLHYHGKHVKGTINHQLQKFTPLLSYVAVIYFTRPGEKEQRRGLMPLGLFLLSLRQDGV